ncbi:tail fiber domain-containing protein [Bdellovibrio svalbardensis]|uniref:Tail fiber domain-containing protein n=1 Tax=Bdellovibrio svalbardensis TaxID=2972972 RepID=A0ABT6DG54_9BACT|nr:tail fiber domain-containing protein [Bdellovibrio svalbardensis]MDG0815834.1 tail fiber domain-containing protein [Bdellovibrio svalbardensis]
MKSFATCTLLALLVIFTAWSAHAAPNSLTYQGRILKADGSALEFNSVSFSFEVTSPDGLCVIYREQINGINMTNSGGVFDVAIGSGTKSFPAAPTFKLLDSFVNSGSVSCDGGATYSPAFDDIRKLRVQFHDGTGWKVISPDSEIRSVPFAGHALTASKLGSYSSSAFVLKTGIPTCTTGTFLSWNGSVLTCEAVAGASGGTVTSVTSTNPYLTVVTGTSTPALTLNVGTTANTVAAGDDARLSDSRTPTGSAGGDLSNTYPNPKVAKIQGVAVATTLPNSGEFFKYNGSQWVPSGITTSDVAGLTASLSSYLTQSYFNTAIASAACTANQTMYWNSATGNFLCQNINVGVAGDVSGSIGAVSVNKLKGVGIDFSVAPTNGQVLRFNGTNWVPGADNNSGGTVTGVTSANSDITVAGTTAPVLTLNSGVTGGAGDANKIAKLDASGLIPSAMLPNHDVSKLTSGVLPIARGGTNSSTALVGNRVMASSGTAIVEAAAITANRALISNASGIPTHSAVTDTELGYLSGVTSSVQTQINSKVSGSGWTNYSVMGVDGSGALTAIPGSVAGSFLTWTAAGPVWTAATVDTFSQYALLAGRAGGQVLNGSTAASGNLTLDSTANATKGYVLLAPTGGNVGIGTSAPVANLEVKKASGWPNFRLASGDAGVTIELNSVGATASDGMIQYGSTKALSFYTDYQSSASPDLTILAAGNVGVGTNSPAAKFDVNGDFVLRGMAAPAVSVAGQGRIYYDSGANKFKVSQNAGAYVDLVGGGGAGTVTSVTSANADISVATGTSTPVLTLNTGTGPSQIVKLDASSRLPAVDGSQLTGLTATQIPNLDAAKITTGTLPVARGGTGLTTGTSGGIPYFSAATTMTSSGVLAANGVVLGGGAGAAPTTTTAGTADQVLRIPGAGGAPAFGAIDLTKAAAVTGVLPIANGGTGVSSLAANRLVGTNGTGTAQQAVTCTLNQILSFDASGNYGCYNVSSIYAGFTNGGNSFGATSNLGNNDNFDLNIKTNNLTRMTVQAGGKVGIGTTSPGSLLTVNGAALLGKASTNYTGTSAGAILGNGTSNPTLIFDASSTSIANLNWNNGILTFGKCGVVDCSSLSPYFSIDTGTNIANFSNTNSLRAGNGYGSAATPTFSFGTTTTVGMFNPAANVLSFATSSSERVRIDASGNVGIGLTSPVEKLHIVGNETAAGMNRAAIRLEDTGIGASWNLVLNGTASADGSNKFSINQTGMGSRFVIDSSGDVGIGTTSPNDKLQVIGAATFYADVVGGVGRVLSIGNDLNVHDIGVANTIGLRGAAAAGEAGLQFGSGGATVYGKSGNIGIGTTTPAVPLDVVGAGGTPMRLKNTTSGGAFWQMGPDSVNNFVIYNSVGTGMYITNGATTWTANSDRRIKRNIELIPNSLNKLSEINGVTYWYKTDPKNESRRVGVIAQDVQKVLPEAVSEKNGILGVRYPELIPLVINAIKEFYAEFKAQSSEQSRKIASLEEENLRLKVEIQETKKAVCELNPKAKICN